MLVIFSIGFKEIHKVKVLKSRKICANVDINVNEGQRLGSIITATDEMYR